MLNFSLGYFPTHKDDLGIGVSYMYIDTDHSHKQGPFKALAYGQTFLRSSINMQLLHLHVVLLRDALLDFWGGVGSFLKIKNHPHHEDGGKKNSPNHWVKKKKFTPVSRGK